MARRALEEFLERVDGHLFALRMIFGDTEKYRELLMAVAGDPDADPELTSSFESLPDLYERRREAIGLLEYLMMSSLLSSYRALTHIKFAEDSSQGIQLVTAEDGSKKFKIEETLLCQDTPHINISPGVLMLTKIKRQIKNDGEDSKITHLLSVIQSVVVKDLVEWIRKEK